MKKDNKILDLFGIHSTKERIRVKYSSIGVLSIVTTYILIKFVLELGVSTAEYGDQFAYNKLFVLTQNAELLKDYKNPKEKKAIRVQTGDVFILKDIKGLFVSVDPMYQGLSNATEISKIIKKFSKKDDISTVPSLEAFIDFRRGDIKTPLQHNVDKLFDTDKDDDAYSLGRVLTFFSIRKNIKYIYYLMSLFLVIFNYVLIKRLIFLYNNYLDQNTIDEIIFSKKDRKVNLNQLIKNESAIVPSAFLSAIHKSFKLDGSKIQFNNIYNDFLERERQLEFSFSQKISLCNVWIIRAGIFGTLVGLIIAFFELYIAVGGIVVGEDLNQGFISQIQQALLGNALSIATSICAHGASLVLEVAIISLISGESNTPWIEASYLKVLNFKEYKPKVKTPVEAITVMSAAVDEMTTEFDLVTNSLKDLSPGAQTTKALIDTMNSALLQINQGLDSINKDLEETQKTTEHFNMIGASIDLKVMDTKKLVEDAHEKMDRLHQESTEASSYLRKNIDSFRTVAGGAIENTQSIISSLSNKLQSLKENITK